jgi:hypothetical protein
MPKNATFALSRKPWLKWSTAPADKFSAHGPQKIRIFWERVMVFEVFDSPWEFISVLWSAQNVTCV